MKRILFLLVVALVVGVWVADEMGYVTLPWGKSGAQTAQSGGPRTGRRRGGAANVEQPVPVLVAPVRVEDVPVTIDSVGTVQALNNVTIRTQADGRLVELAFKDGQDVKKGDVLARIDPATYQASYDQAVAKKAQDEAQLANARIDFERYQKLAQSNYGSKQQADTQKSTVAQLEAQVRSDQAAIDNAKAILDYTTIRAPIDGRTGIRGVDVGNIVHASDATGIVTITQVRPIALLFTLPQQNLRTANAALARGPVKVQALESDNARVIEEGIVSVVDNQVDQTTGTVRVKATFGNADLQLWPGQFVNVRLFVDVLKNALVAPTSSVQRGPDGAFVYVLREDTVALVKVSVIRQSETDAVLAAGGVKSGDLVVTTGFAQLTDGRKVRADQPQAAAAPGDVVPAASATGAGRREPSAERGSPAAGAGDRQRRRDGARGQGAGPPQGAAPNPAGPAP
jgi:multidrug efflux system membrane fusion protein